MDIREASLGYLTFRDRTEKEMADHLAKKGFSEEEIRNEIEFLEGLHYLDDVRFAKVFIEYSLEKKRGMIRIRRELKEKGVSEFDIEDGLADAEYEYDFEIKERERRAAEESASSFMDGKEPDEKAIRRLAGRLKRAGFGAAVVYDIADSYRRKK